MNNQFIDLIDKRIEQKLGAKQNLKREPAKVVSVSSGYKRAAVKLLNGVTIELLNKTGEKLYVGESVWIEYRTNPSSGYIAMRNGEADPLGGGEFVVNNAAVLTEGQAARYLSEQEVINVDVNNMNKVVYGAPRNNIIVQGNLCVPNDSAFYVADDITSEITLKIPDINLIDDSTEETLIDTYHYFSRMAFTYQSNTSTYPYNRQWIFNSYYSKNSDKAVTANQGSAPAYRESIPVYVGFLFSYSSIVAAVSPAAPYGYINGSSLRKFVFDENKNIIQNSSGGTFSGVSLYRTSIPFASQAELDYALSVTQRAEVAPSIAEKV